MCYDIADEGYHSPLTSEEISDLFVAGRVHRATPCKVSGQPRWRTIDELFPLLKYNAVWSSYEGGQAKPSPFEGRMLAAALGSAAILFLLGLGYFCLSEREWPKPLLLSTARVAGPNAATSPLAALPGHVANTFPPTATRQAPITTTSLPSGQTTRLPATDNRATAQMEARSQQERRRREQEQRHQTANAERTRSRNEREAAERQQAAGTDTIAPLDTWFPVDVGGSPVNLKVHDNDVTSFDIWIDGAWRREVAKNKGISGSRTDETFVASRGNAQLFYVWELSGKLNHCRMRVRKN